MKLCKQEITYKDSRIKIIVDKKSLIKIAFDELIKQRTFIEDYIKKNPLFKVTLAPIKIKKNAPNIVKEMAYGADIANVGPMAAVAGTIAEFVCKKLIREKAKTAIIENGGDIFAYTEKPINIGIFSGQDITSRFGVRLNKENTPIAICSSSSKLGHSLSFGDCDLATVFSKKATIADAVATAACNKVKKESDIKKVLNWANSLEGVDGLIIIKNNKFGFKGEIPKLIIHKDEKIKEKITKDPGYY